MSTHGRVARGATERDAELYTLPEELGSAEAKLVYHSLDAAGPGDVDELARRLGLKKMALFSVLDSLRSQELIERDGRQYRCT